MNGTFSKLICVVVVFDFLDSSSQSTFEVLVEEVKMELDDLSVYLLNGLNTSRMNTNSDDLKNILSSTTTVLNRVNCSGSVDCVGLNREDCSLLGGTCGECLSGYVGLLGFSNTPCLSSSSLESLESSEQRRLLLTTLSSSSSSSPSTIMSCESDVDCEDYGLFVECNVESKVCQSIQQSCPNSCSGHGKCVFLSKYDSNVTLLECGLLEVDCVSVCECDEDFLGSSCSFPREEFLKQMDLRGVIVENVGELMSMENVDRSNLKSWMKSLSSIGSDDSSLSVESKKLMTSLTI